ncbi:MAG: acyl-CoA thioesterase [Nitratireductor sp.]
MNENLFETVFSVEFGDCDPAGIAFYPNYFKWLDATFHHWLREHGLNQELIGTRFGAVGTGLLEAGASFRAPMRPGDYLKISISSIEWSKRTFKLTYLGTCDGNLTLEGHEVRGLLKNSQEGKLSLMPLEQLRAIIE